MSFEILGEIDDIETIAGGPSVRERVRLTAQFGRGRWRKLKGIATVRLRDGWIGRAELTLVRGAWHWSSQVQDKAFPGMSMKETKRNYVICIHVDEPTDLEVRKVYEVLPDESAARRGYVRVVDESGEDYLYPKECFASVHLPEEAVRAFKSPPSRTRANKGMQPTAQKTRRG